MSNLPTEKTIIELKNIDKYFVTDTMETKALDDINLSINQGDFVTISGPSGCGKSTLLSVLGLIDKPDSGEYRFNNVDLYQQSDKHQIEIRTKNIGFIFQAFNLIGDLTSYANIELPLIYKRINKEQRTQIVNECLEKVGMSHRKDHYPSQLSGGQQQRVAIARALAIKPDILLADEPTGNLDDENSLSIMNLLKALNSMGTTICVVTHNPAHKAFGNKQINIESGRINDCQILMTSAA